MSEEWRVPVAIRVSGDGIRKRHHATVVLVLAVALSAVAVIVSRPEVETWLRIRAAYSQLWHPDRAERHEAFQWLVGHGEDPDAELLEMLEHPSQDYRLFSGEELSSRPSRPEITEAFLRLLEDDQYLKEIDGPLQRESLCRSLLLGIGRHAEVSEGPLSETDERIIALLKPMLTDSNVLDADAAQVLAEYLPRRAELAPALQPYAEGAYRFGAMKVARGFYRTDPATLPKYLDLLLQGLSGNGFERQRAAKYLIELGTNADAAVPRLEALKTDSPRLAKEIEQVLKEIRGASDQSK